MPSSVVVAGVFTDPELQNLPPGANDEYVVLVNTGDEPAALPGWSLTNLKADKAHHYRYLFPRFLSNGDPWELEPGGMILLYTGRGSNGCTASAGEARQYHFFQHRGTRVWVDDSDRVCLFDRSGTMVASHDVVAAERLA